MEGKEPCQPLEEGEKGVKICGNKCLKFQEKTPLLRNERRSGTNGGEEAVSLCQRRIGRRWK